MECLICKQTYKDMKCYNEHLRRKLHQREYNKFYTLHINDLIDKKKWEKIIKSNERKKKSA